MKNILFLTPPDAKYGFSLTGALQLVTEYSEVNTVLQDLLAEPPAQLLILDERLLKVLPEHAFTTFESKWNGAIIILPAPEKMAETEDYAMQLITKALGYHIRLHP